MKETACVGVYLCVCASVGHRASLCPLRSLWSATGCYLFVSLNCVGLYVCPYFGCMLPGVSQDIRLLHVCVYGFGRGLYTYPWVPLGLTLLGVCLYVSLSASPLPQERLCLTPLVQISLWCVSCVPLRIGICIFKRKPAWVCIYCLSLSCGGSAGPGMWLSLLKASMWGGG